ncbi:metal-dependent hydrolase [Aquirhabdus sp.]|uniref:metal-dependent hydrolase n=1 Tax=Aquirhabdus sp. TaxID=2824160 RepID=UPI00396C7979
MQSTAHTTNTISQGFKSASHHPITVRRPEFNFAQLPKYYFNNNPLLSHLLTALSLTFPNGERFFVHSVRNVRDQVKTATLKSDVSAFIGQEAMHSHAHEDFNDFAKRIGLDVQPIIDSEYEKVEQIKGVLTPKQQLAVTCALEHFTAIIAQYLLEHDDFHTQLHPDAARLWMWHALEETEHKAVAFDVYREVFNDEVVRKRTMRIITTTFISRISYITGKLLLNDKEGRLQFKQHWLAFQQLKAMAKTLLPAYLDYYKNDFHPNQHDSNAIADEWRGVLFAN